MHGIANELLPARPNLTAPTKAGAVHLRSEADGALALLSDRLGVDLLLFPETIREPGHAQRKVSAQIFSAQLMAWIPSSAFAAVDTPPEPGTTRRVFLSAS